MTDGSTEAAQALHWVKGFSSILIGNREDDRQSAERKKRHLGPLRSIA
jgi:hypothetical protein